MVFASTFEFPCKKQIKVLNWGDALTEDDVNARSASGSLKRFPKGVNTGHPDTDRHIIASPFGRSRFKLMICYNQSIIYFNTHDPRSKRARVLLIG